MINQKLIEKKLIDSAIRIIKEGEGCLFVIKKGDLSYEPLMVNDFKPFSIFEDIYQKRMDILAKVDGACIINDKGELIAYGMRINSTMSFTGFGTRHSAAYTASYGNLAILGSQENKKVRIFKEGRIIMQIDALEKGIEQQTGNAVSILESVGVGTLGAIGAGLMLPTLGITLIPGILVFGSSHFIAKYILKDQGERQR
jgi:DNA integrity scanning protein DisA with diadenylate cyclase activity